jgi:hypothetical protein
MKTSFYAMYVSYALLYPTRERAIAWNLREMGSAWGKGGKGGPDPPRCEGDKQTVLNRGRNNMDKMKKDQHEQSEPFFPKTRIM